jgi:hypothetical protein
MVVLKNENDVQEILQSVGVQQGDNTAPVLFLFLMSTFVETLEPEWKNASIGACMVRSAIGGWNWPMAMENCKDTFQRITALPHETRVTVGLT